MVAIFNSGNVELVANVPVDQITAEFHSASASPTTFAVETGAQLSDHIILDPETVEVNWMISNLDDGFTAYGTRAATNFEKIKNALSSRQLYDVVTRHYLYENMVMTSISAETTSPFIGQLVGRVSFQKFNQATIEAATIEQLSSSAQKTASKQVDSGKVEAAVNEERSNAIYDRVNRHINKTESHEYRSLEK